MVNRKAFIRVYFFPIKKTNKNTKNRIIYHFPNVLNRLIALTKSSPFTGNFAYENLFSKVPNSYHRLDMPVKC